MATSVKKVKSWLNDRKEKIVNPPQFEIVENVFSLIVEVRRLSDGQTFHIDNTGLFLYTGHKIEKIINFMWDKIHVDVWIEGNDHQELIPINEISLEPIRMQ